MNEDFLAAQFERTSRPPARCRLPHARIRRRRPMTRVQETWLRLSRSDTASIENLGGWLTTVTARVCLNMLRSRRTRRRSRWSRTCPTRSCRRAEAVEPEHEAVLADSVGLALLVVLETLDASRAVGLRPPRHVRRAVRRDRRDGRPIAGSDPSAGQPCPAPGPAGQRPRHGRAPPARDRRRLLRRGTRWRPRSAGRRARSRRRRALRWRHRRGHRLRSSHVARGASHVAPSPSRSRARRSIRSSSTAAQESWSSSTARCSRSWGSPSPAARSSRSMRSPIPSASPKLDLSALDAR